ncbi:MAG: hypothetical protein ISP42_05965 [Alphaproteobacteria bacterium]|nr:hypothetical protein [Alphaproteobacteria bacterium]
MRQPVVIPKKAAILRTGQVGLFVLAAAASLVSASFVSASLGKASLSARAENPLFIYVAPDRIADNPFL